MNNCSEIIKLIGVRTDDLTDYKKTALLLAFPKCMKNCDGCQNEHLRELSPHNYNVEDILSLYNRLSEHQAIVCAGLDPMDSVEDLEKLIVAFNANANKKPVDFVIYTGYTIDSKIYQIVKYKLVKLITNEKFHLIVKYGNYDKNNKNSYKSKILGVELVGDNQVVEQYDLINRFILTQKDCLYEQEEGAQED